MMINETVATRWIQIGLFYWVFRIIFQIMNTIDIEQEKESGDPCASQDMSHESDKKYEKSGESTEESYEAYRLKGSPERNTSYRAIGQDVENVNDRFDQR